LVGFCVVLCSVESSIV